MKINKMGILVIFLSLGLTVVPISLNLNNNNSDNNNNQVKILPEVFEEGDINPPTDEITLPDQENEATRDLPQKSQVDPEKDDEQKNIPEEENKIPTQTKPTIKAAVDIKPNTLCSRSRGRWINVFVELQVGYDIQDIDVSTIMLNGTIAPNNYCIKYGDFDEDGIPDIRLKFTRSDLIDFLQDCVDGNVELSIEGKLYNDKVFAGSDTIKLLHFND